jgi:hypothetical protein
MDETQVDKFQIEDLVITDSKVGSDADIAQSKIHNLESDLASKINKSGDIMTGSLILNGNPTQPLHAVPKQYVDLKSGNLLSQLDAIVSIYGLKITWTGNKTISVSSGAIKINGILYHFTNNLNIDLTTQGVGGLDTGVIQADKFYYIHALVNSTTQSFAVIASLSGTAPTLPNSFDKSKLIGAVRTDGTNNLLRFKTIGNQSYRKLLWEDMIEAPNATAGPSPWSTINLSSYIPLDLTKCVAIDMRFLVGAGVTSEAFIRKGGSTATNGSFSYFISDAYYKKTYYNYAAGTLEGDIFTSNTGTIEFRGPGLQVLYAKGFSWDL